jgi:hypothetical protein
MYQSATGAGQDLSMYGYPNASIPSGQKASFRRDVSKLILLWTDAPFHRPGDSGAIPYPGQSFSQTAAAILQAGIDVFTYDLSGSSISTVTTDNPEENGPRAKVLGVSSGTAAIPDLSLIARMTGSFAGEGGVDCNADGVIDIAPGGPLVCSISATGEGIGEAIVALVEAASGPTIVDIDIKPGSDPNSVNCQNPKEVITVAILTTDEFDALSVDHSTILFEGASEAHVDKNGIPQRHEEDVDSDGDIDLVLHFRFKDTTISCESTSGTLTGETYEGQAVQGTDSLNMVNVKTTSLPEFPELFPGTYIYMPLVHRR